jgi:hypothetical protein
MCYDYEFDYLARRAEEARKQLQKAEEQRRKEQQPAAPVEVPEEKPVPA